MANGETSRLFFAIWPDEAVRLQIKAAPFPKLKAKTTPPENWHITLVFLGACSAREQTQFTHAADEVRFEPLQLTLDTTGQFSRARVVWLGCGNRSIALEDFQQKLLSALREICPDHSSLAQPVQAYTPHLTLYRNIRQPCSAHPIPAIPWKVNRFSLVESRRGIQPLYRTIKSWRLGD